MVLTHHSGEGYTVDLYFSCCWACLATPHIQRSTLRILIF